MSVISSSSLLVLQLWVAVVMVIVALSRQSIDCKLSVVVCRCMEVRRTIMLYFRVAGLIVSCGCFWWFGDQIWVSVVSDSRPGGFDMNR